MYIYIGPKPRLGSPINHFLPAAAKTSTLSPLRFPLGITSEPITSLILPSIQSNQQPPPSLESPSIKSIHPACSSASPRWLDPLLMPELLQPMRRPAPLHRQSHARGHALLPSRNTSSSSSQEPLVRAPTSSNPEHPTPPVAPVLLSPSKPQLTIASR